jgi:signal recognition particle receptor subunit beta
MIPEREPKLLFAGPMGAGKTTAIRAISDLPPVSTEAANIDVAQHSKAETTVGMDYGETQLDDGSRLRLYGLPGQSRFDFMWKILTQGAMGLILLIDNSREDAVDQMHVYLDAFENLARTSSVVIGVGRLSEGSARISDYSAALQKRGLQLPVFGVDVRQRDDVLLLLETLLHQIEAFEWVSQ